MIQLIRFFNSVSEVAKRWNVNLVFHHDNGSRNGIIFAKVEYGSLK